jgi:hypothetical protein
MHNYFLISKDHRGQCTSMMSTRAIARSPEVLEGKKSLANGCPFHALALRDTDLVLGHGSGSSVDGHNCSFITINYCMK